MPDQDPTWPVCHFTPPCAGDWCPHVQNYLYDGKDGERLDFGMRICVPVQPSLGFYAEVSIDSESISGIMAKLALVREGVVKDPFGIDTEELISLGMWTVGEGRFVIALALANWIEGQPAIDKCIWHAHSFQQEMRLQHPDSKHPAFQKANNWCLAYYGMCYPCYEADQQKQGAAVIPDFTGSAFGMGEVEPPRGGAAAGATPRQNRTRDALRQRYGNQTYPPVNAQTVAMTQSDGSPIELRTQNVTGSNASVGRHNDGRSLAGWDASGTPYFVNPNGTVSP